MGSETCHLAPLDQMLHSHRAGDAYPAAMPGKRRTERAGHWHHSCIIHIPECSHSA